MLTLLPALVLLVSSAAPARAAEPGVGGVNALALLNAQRQANALPAGITFRQDWANNCQKHVSYEEQNGGQLTHQEDLNNQYYTPEGAEAGRSSVLGGVWTGGTNPYATNPYESAPIHLMQLLGPSLSQTGIWGGCAYTWPGYQRPVPASPRVLSYPGNGTHGIYTSEVANEGPFVPGDFVGLPQGTRTGPHIFLLAWGTLRGTLSHASLTGPAGAAAIRTIDDHTSHNGTTIGPYLPAGGMIIPVHPLSAGTRYSVKATFTSNAQWGQPAHTLPVSFSFVTAGHARAAARFASVRARRHGTSAGVRATLVPKLRDQRLRVELRTAKGRKLAARTVRTGAGGRIAVSFHISRRAGALRIVLSIGASTRYGARKASYAVTRS